MKILKICLAGLFLIIASNSHAAWTSVEGQKIKSLDSGFDGMFYVLLDGYVDINCTVNGILIDINESESHDEDNQSFDVMFTMLLSAFHSETFVRLDVDTSCRGSRIQIVN